MTTMLQCNGPGCGSLTPEATPHYTWLRVEVVAPSTVSQGQPMHFCGWPCVAVRAYVDRRDEERANDRNAALERSIQVGERWSEAKTSQQWLEEADRDVLDPDGWRTGFTVGGIVYPALDMYTPIGQTEFGLRLSKSTVRPK